MPLRLYLSTAYALAFWLCAFAHPLTAHGQTVYRCGHSYSSTPCAGGTSISTEPAVTGHAQPTLTAPQQHALRKQRQKEREWKRTERELDKAQAASPPQRKSSNQAACQSKARRIQKIDELARRGGSAKKMEQLREERRDARDWQFSAGC